MENNFEYSNTANVWQVSNPPILSMVPIKAALDIIKDAGGIQALRKKSISMSKYFDYLLEKELDKDIELITPTEVENRGCQLSLKVINKNISGREVFNSLLLEGVSCDWRYPDVIRVAPVPLYNSYIEIFNFIKILKSIINNF